MHNNNNTQNESNMLVMMTIEIMKDTNIEKKVEITKDDSNDNNKDDYVAQATTRGATMMTIRLMHCYLE